MLWVPRNSKWSCPWDEAAHLECRSRAVAGSVSRVVCVTGEGLAAERETSGLTGWGDHLFKPWALRDSLRCSPCHPLHGEPRTGRTGLCRCLYSSLGGSESAPAPHPEPVILASYLHGASVLGHRPHFRIASPCLRVSTDSF